jgi:chromate transporter
VSAEPSAVAEAVPTVPRETLGRLFLRFLRFGALAWGGPVAQIAMIRQELVEEEHWVSREQFNRVLALYQVLPGPEAHELCVYFGMLSRGRIGGMLAGLGFMLPGFVLMFLFSWLYVRHGLQASGPVAPIFAAVQAAVAALIVRAVHRIGSHALTDRWLWVIALLATGAQLLSVHFAISLFVGGALYLAVRSTRPAIALAFVGLCGSVLLGWILLQGSEGAGSEVILTDSGQLASAEPSLLQLWLSGLKAGALTFGGAYTVIPFLQHDAVSVGAWMTNEQFLDGLALSGLLPAPLIIVATFVGFLGGGAVGALVLTVAIFLPAFAFTLLVHNPLERLVAQPRVRAFLDGVTAAVVGLIVGTTIALVRASITDIQTALIFLLALAALFYWHAKLLVPAVIAGAALWGFAQAAAGL